MSSNQSTLWNWERDGVPLPPGPEKIAEYLRHNAAVTSLVFARDSLPCLLVGAAAATLDRFEVMTFEKFASIYRQSVEFAWLACCALIGSDEEDPNDLMTVERREEVVCLTVQGAAIEKIRKQDTQTIHRARLVPDVAAGIIFDFYTANLSPFVIAMGPSDTEALCKGPNTNVFSIASAEFCRARLEPRDHPEYQKHYSLKNRLKPYGMLDRGLRYKIAIEEPHFVGRKKVITSYMCFPAFTHIDQAGLSFVIESSEPNPRDSCDRRGAKRIPDSVWWFNNHDCNSCETDLIRICPDHHFEAHGEGPRQWRDMAIAPYIQYKVNEFRQRTSFDQLILIETGVRFESDLLGMFYSIYVRFDERGDARRRQLKEKISNFMTVTNHRLGHARFLMMENLAAEIAKEHRELSDARKRHGEMLQLLNQPIENLRRRVLDAIDDARRITQIIQGPHMVPFTKSAEVAKYFEEGGHEVIGNSKYEIRHQPGTYLTAGEQAAIFSAIIIKMFGEEWRHDEGPLDLFRRANLLITKSGGVDQGLSEICRDLTGLADRTARAQIEDQLSAAGSGQNTMLTRALTRLKEVLHTPAKEDAAHYPWTPLLLIAFGGGDSEHTVDLTIRVGTKEWLCSNLADAMEWAGADRGSFLDSLLPVPRYDMLLTFLASVMAYARNVASASMGDDNTDGEWSRIRFSISRDQAGSIWSIQINFGTIIFDEASDRGELKRRMRECWRSGSWPTYVGNFYGPFLAWAAECVYDADSDRNERDDSAIFSVYHRNVETSISFKDNGRTFVMIFERKSDR
jgi:hypothetical protein